MFVLAALAIACPLSAGGLKSAVLNTKHNLSVTGPGPVTSSEQDACIFCHTPHSSYVEVKPLWNHMLGTQTYSSYSSSTLDAGPGSIVSGTSKTCLSCHDGTVALGYTVSRGLIPTGGSMGSGAILGYDLTNDHPVSIQPVDDGQLSTKLFLAPPATEDPVVLVPQGRVECTSCHEPHQDNLDVVSQKFLVRSNSGGAICLACHDPGRAQPNWLNGWTTGAHAIAGNTVPTTESSTPYGSVSANACGSCHRLHGTALPSGPRLLRAPEEQTCDLCHSGINISPTPRNIKTEFNKMYSHPTYVVSGQHDPAEAQAPVSASRHAECVDCHDPHSASNTGGATSAPGVPSALLGTGGYNGGAALRPASAEFEVCFKCHADSGNKPQGPGYSVYGRTVVRQTNSLVGDPYNLRLKFFSGVSRHNVSSPRVLSGSEVPSLRPYMLNLDGSPGRSLGLGTQIYCTDCHNNNQARKFNGSGPNGPHGSTWKHLLERRYEIEPLPSSPGSWSIGVQYQPGLNGTYALCDKCHDIEGSILQGDSFSEHRKHIRDEDASCSTCHDPHGIHGGNSTNNSHLINMDVEVAAPSMGMGNRLEYVDTGQFRGACYVRCHRKNHSPKRYP